MFNYKVEYIYTSKAKKKWYESSANLETNSLAKEVEALLVEYDEKGFELVSITPINSYETLGGGSLTGTHTDGLLVTFKKRNVS